MAQSPGFLNTAPPPIPGGGTNPTGGRIALPQANLPSLSPTNVLTPQAVQGGANASLFPANTGGTSSTNIGNIDLGFQLTNKNAYGNLYRELTRAYGQGTGSMIFQMLTGGMWNSQIANALINAMQPMRTRGLNDVLGSFSAEGGRFSSAAATGVGDFESQFALNEQSTLANLALQDQEMQMNLLMGILPTLHGEQANKGGILGDILGGLEVAGGALMTGLSGGALAGPGAMLMSGGIGTITGKGGGGGATPSSVMPLNTSGIIQNQVNPIMNSNDPNSLWTQYYQQMLEGQAGTVWDTPPTPQQSSDIPA